MGDGHSIDISGLDTEALRQLRAKIDGILDGPADRDGDLDAAIGEMKAMRARVADVGKAAVSKAIKAFLANHPEVESVRWRQYTPYFNDGDACEFSVRDPEVKLVGANGEEGDREDGYEDRYSLEYRAKKEGLEIPATLPPDLEAMGSLFEEAEDAMKATFGDHAQVTVGRDGEAEVEEYQHD